jgi:hypothetical protein
MHQDQVAKKNQRTPANGGRPLFAGILGLALVSAACLVAMPAAADGFKAGVELREQASLSEIGLPAYPGATVQQDKADDKAAVTLGLWGGSLGFKLQVRKFASGDALETVAAFYQDALAQYGQVLDCSKPQPKPKPANKDEDRLSCGDETPKPGSRVYKVGTDKDFRMVAVQPKSTGVHFQLLRMVAKGI